MAQRFQIDLRKMTELPGPDGQGGDKVLLEPFSPTLTTDPWDKSSLRALFSPAPWAAWSRRAQPAHKSTGSYYDD